jgi:integrase
VKALALIPRVRGTRSVPRALNADQVSRFVRSLDTPKQRVIVGAMLWLGLRCAEVANMNVEDINEREASVLVNGKGGHERMIPIPPEFAPFLNDWLDYRRRLPGPLVFGREGRYNPTTISTLVSQWMRASGVKVASLDGRSAHSLRHTAASDVLDRGANIRTVQELLGHQHLSTTSTYLRRAKLDDLRKAMGGRDYAA